MLGVGNKCTRIRQCQLGRFYRQVGAVAGPSVPRGLLRYFLAQDISVRIRLASLPDLADWGGRFLAACNEEAWRASAAALNAMVAHALDGHRRLAGMAGADHLIRATGFLRLYRRAQTEHSSALELAVLRAHGVAAEVLDAAAIREIEPALAHRFERGWLFTQSASVSSPGQVVERYREAFLKRGGELVPGLVDDVVVADDGFTLSVGGQGLRAAHLVLAGGIGSAHLAGRLGYRIPLAAERGYHQRVAFANGATLARPVFDAEGGYVISPIEGAARILSGSEIAWHGAKPNYGQLRAVVRDAASTVQLDPANSKEPWHGSRPATPDGLPVIGRADRHPNLVFAFGHGHIGFANGPVTGRVVSQILSGEPPLFPLHPFSAVRFTR